MQSAGEKVFVLTSDVNRIEAMRKYNIPTGKAVPLGATVVIADRNMPSTADASRITWALTDKPPRSATYSIVADKTGSTVIRAHGTAHRVFWTSSTDERAFMSQ